MARCIRHLPYPVQQIGYLYPQDPGNFFKELHVEAVILPAQNDIEGRAVGDYLPPLGVINIPPRRSHFNITDPVVVGQAAVGFTFLDLEIPQPRHQNGKE